MHVDRVYQSTHGSEHVDRLTHEWNITRIMKDTEINSPNQRQIIRSNLLRSKVEFSDQSRYVGADRSLAYYREHQLFHRDRARGVHEDHIEALSLAKHLLDKMEGEKYERLAYKFKELKSLGRFI